MSKVIAILGAGTGRGSALARRFGREGFRVALVARRKDRLDEIAAKLAAEGIEAVGFTADLSDPAGVPTLIGAIRERFGRIDVIEYGPLGTGDLFSPAVELTAEALQKVTPMLLLTPVEVVRAVMQEWTERGDGAIIVTHGSSAINPMPGLSGIGVIMAAMRNYLYSLNGGLAGSGVYAGTVAVGALIGNSEWVSTMADAPSDALPPGGMPPVIDPDELAEQYWNLYTTRDRVEVLYPPAEQRKARRQPASTR